MKRAALLCVLFGSGCGPFVILPQDTDGNETVAPQGTSSDGGPQSDVSGGGDDGPFGSSGPGPTSAFPGTSGFGTSGFGSSGFGSSGQPVPAQCWVSSPLFEVPEDARLFAVDQDGDGTDELWVSFFSGGGPGASSELSWINPEGIPEFGGEFNGFFTGLHDIDGDGIRDGVGFAFGGGGPPDLAFIRGEPFFPAEGPSVEMGFGFEDGFEAFVDLSGDGIADFLRNADGTTTTELLLGDGAGMFFPTASTESPFEGDLSATLIEGSGTVVIAESEYFDPVEACVGHPLAGIALGFDALVTQWVLEAQGEFAMSAPLATWIANDGRDAIIARACNPRTNGVVATILASDGNILESTTLAESTFVAAGDFDGQGLPDIAMGDGVGITFAPNTGSTSFETTTYDEVPYGQPVLNRVYSVDIDLDGRDEIILGTRDGGSEIVYERLDLEPC